MASGDGMRQLTGRRASVWLMSAVLLVAVQGCTGETLSPASTPEVTISAPSTDSSPTTEPSLPAVTTEASATSEAATTDPQTTPVTVPAEASTLPLPSDDTRVDALNPQEMADRAAVEAVWQDVWNLVPQINEIPATERAAAVDPFMVDPIRTQLLSSADDADTRGATTYGSITLHPYWYRAVGGLPYAVIGDCRDASQFGAADRATGEKKSVGTKDNNTVGKFVKIDGRWKLFDVTYVQDVPCTVG